MAEANPAKMQHSLPGLFIKNVPSEHYGKHLEQKLTQHFGAGKHVILFMAIMAQCSREIIGLEALYRWQSLEQWKIIPPLEIFPVIDQEAAIDLHAYVISKTIMQYAVLQHWLPWRGQIWINFEADLLTNPFLIQLLVNLCQAYELDTQRVVLELSARKPFLQQRDDLSFQQNLTTIKELGIQFALEEFGRVHSTPPRIQTVGAHYLKLSRAAMQTIYHNMSSNSELRAIMSIAQRYQCQVVASGVEGEASATLLDHIGIELIQGYLLSPPQSLNWWARHLAVTTQFPLQIVPANHLTERLEQSSQLNF